MASALVASFGAVFCLSRLAMFVPACNQMFSHLACTRRVHGIALVHAFGNLHQQMKR
jgi:hypothetical protein